MPFLNANESVVIILNGPSSVGKSSIQKALQKQSKKDFLRVGIDTFFDALIETPDLTHFERDKKFDQYSAHGEYIRGIELTNDDEGHPIVTLKIGAAGDRIIAGMHRAVGAYAKAGNNVVVDYILYKPEWADDLQESLKGSKVYMIGVTAPLDVIEARESARNTSPRGHARSHYNTVHEGMKYDLLLDTSKLTSAECAEKIIALIEKN